MEAVRGRQRIGVVAEMVLAELAGVVAEIAQEPGERRGAGPQIGGAARQLRRDHAGAQRMHAGEEGIAPGRAALLGIVGHELRAFIADAVDVGRFPDHQAAVVDARLHPADVVAHDEQDVGLGLLLGLQPAPRTAARRRRPTVIAARATCALAAFWSKASSIFPCRRQSFPCLRVVVVCVASAHGSDPGAVWFSRR